nr:GEVED domain-containing protein [uncultured Arsenicibacter sp.]
MRQDKSYPWFQQHNRILFLSRLVYLLLFSCITFSAVSVYGQQVPYRCGIDSVRQPPGYDSFSRNGNSGFYPKATQEDTSTYRIPVVFIIYHLGEPQGTGSNISDESVGYVLNLINERFAGIGVNGYRGQDSKIRFLLAKRTQRCNATSGIIRVDGRSVPGYEANGNTDYNIQQQLAALVPDFFDQSTRSGVLVINLYHRVGGGAFAYYGGAVHMTVPGEVDLNPYNYVPTHEVGHSLHLFHPYEGSFQQGDQYTCPADTYNDLVEDTQPTRNQDPYFACNPDAGELINSCTGLPFGTQLRNLMTFGCDQDRFTPGQIARMRYFLANEDNWLASSGFYRPLTPDELPASPVCQLSTPPAVTGYYFGISAVSINSFTKASAVTSSKYTDYSCSYRANATAGQPLFLSVSGFGTFGRVYIDYNADGAFDESSELVMSFRTINEVDLFTSVQSVTIPANAVLNRVLRVRVIFDMGYMAPTSCSLPGRPGMGFGEIEEYGLMIVAPACESVRTGSWYDPATWSCGHVPDKQTNVVIKAGHTVTLDQQTPKAVCRHLVLQGTLIHQQGTILINGN